MAQHLSSVTGLLRGAAAITDHINSHLKGGKPLSRHAVYRMIEADKIPVRRLGSKGEVWTTTEEVDATFGIATAAQPAE